MGPQGAIGMIIQITEHSTVRWLHVNGDILEHTVWMFLWEITGNPDSRIELNIQACSASFRIFPRMSTLWSTGSVGGFTPAPETFTLQSKTGGFKGFLSLISSIKADYSFVLQASSGAACSCFHIIRNHYQLSRGSSEGIDLLFSNNIIIISKSGCIRLRRQSLQAI